VRSGIITETKVSVSSNEDIAAGEAENFDHVLKDKSIQDIKDFSVVLGGQADHMSSSEISGISTWLNAAFGKSP
jgi:Mn-dependent DtxR family transcriptional regulator